MDQEDYGQPEFNFNVEEWDPMGLGVEAGRSADATIVSRGLPCCYRRQRHLHPCDHAEMKQVGDDRE